MNLAVAFAKIGYGILSNTLSMKADGYHSLFDGISNIVGLLGCWMASRPPDKEHPYGHQKYETLASAIIALLLIYVGLEIFLSSLMRLFTRSIPEVTSVSFLVMLGTMGINFLVTRYEFKKGTSLQSPVLIADSMHTKSDIFVSFSVLISLLAVKFGYPLLDPVIAFLISFLILREGYLIIRQSSNVLCDMSRMDEEEVCNVAMQVQGVLDCHKIRTRGGLGDIKIDLHVLLSPETSVEDAHRVSHQVSRALKSEFKEVSDVVVHIEPALPQPQGSNTKKTT